MATPNKKTKTQKGAFQPVGSKRLRAAWEGVDHTRLYPLADAIKLVKQNANSKFDETIDIAINLDVDAKQSEQSVRGVVAMPNGIGKTVRVAVFAREDKFKEAKDAGADIVGNTDLVEQIEKGQIDFDRCIATPDMMPVLGKVAKILGPKGLMPNPKLGTVTVDVGKAVRAAKSGQVEFRAEKAGLIHAGLGKASFSEKALTENIRAFVDAIQQAKPSGIKGAFLKKVALSSTMGPGVKIDISSLKA